MARSPFVELWVFVLGRVYIDPFAEIVHDTINTGHNMVV
ncbi:uncharacterized protein G2W53_001647 [Senna tora]|uniref:Uncharacterized protein n=1 Tax=Senna tora TaxID=362788 RepID=A0A835CMQ4_9FABA|nr:uncharacterized protein G2W53_001647 [Senna tora]